MGSAQAPASAPATTDLLPKEPYQGPTNLAVRQQGTLVVIPLKIPKPDEDAPLTPTQIDGLQEVLAIFEGIQTITKTFSQIFSNRTRITRSQRISDKRSVVDDIVKISDRFKIILQSCVTLSEKIKTIPGVTTTRQSHSALQEGPTQKASSTEDALLAISPLVTTLRTELETSTQKIQSAAGINCDGLVNLANYLRIIEEILQSIAEKIYTAPPLAEAAHPSEPEDAAARLERLKPRIQTEAAKLEPLSPTQNVVKENDIRTRLQRAHKALTAAGLSFDEAIAQLTRICGLKPQAKTLIQNIVRAKPEDHSSTWRSNSADWKNWCLALDEFNAGI